MPWRWFFRDIFWLFCQENQLWEILALVRLLSLASCLNCLLTIYVYISLRSIYTSEHKKILKPTFLPNCPMGQTVYWYIVKISFNIIFKLYGEWILSRPKIFGCKVDWQVFEIDQFSHCIFPLKKYWIFSFYYDWNCIL